MLPLLVIISNSQLGNIRFFRADQFYVKFHLENFNTAIVKSILYINTSQTPSIMDSGQQKSPLSLKRHNNTGESSADTATTTYHPWTLVDIHSTLLSDIERRFGYTLCLH